MRPRSIRGALLVWSGGLTLLALAAVFVVLSALLSQFVTRRLAAELEAGAQAVMAAAEWTAPGELSVLPPPADPRFERPLSGWYWQVSGGGRVLARSLSLVTADLGPDGASPVGPDGAALLVRRETFTAPGSGLALSVVVSLPQAEAAAELAAIRGPLAIGLAVLGASLMLAQALAVRAGLGDLTRFASSVAAVRDGRKETVPPARAAELVPLAQELDRLIRANRSQLERARAHAGDLAHALKTPLAVLSNRAREEDAPLIARMDATIRWHLKRARAGAAGLSPTARTALADAFSDLRMVLAPEAGRRGVRLDLDMQGAPAFRGDAEDLAEMLGTLVENAVAWAAAEVSVRAAVVDGRLVIEVRDDGPGIPVDQRERLLRRGVRLDVSAPGHGPGHGLGLAIAADRAALYGGTLDLADAPGGGLCARLVLPAAP